MPHISAVLFDLDGTLVDSVADIAAALAGAMDDAGLPPPTLDEVRGWVGGGAHKLVTLALAGRGDADFVLARYQERYNAEPVAATRLYPGIDDALHALVASGHTLAVLSNKPQSVTEKVAAILLGRWPFAAVRGQRAGVPLKPHPAAALDVAATLGVPTASWAFVGDHPGDVGTARGAGMRAVAVSWGYRPREELVAAAPDVIVDSPADLPAAL